MKSLNIAAVVVTYNRKDLLIECLDAILRQTYPVSQIILIDNASTDGTKEVLEAKGYLDLPVMNYQLMASNTGGAGGFFEGMKIVRDTAADWAWIMDDDTIPSETCLQEMINGLEAISKASTSNISSISYLASAVYGENGEFMNVPTISSNYADNGYATWYEYLKEGIVEIDHATFVSVLINCLAVKKCGLPCKDFFIWGDDGEYTKRLSHFYGKAYMVGKSVAIHKRKNAKSLKYNSETDPDRIKMRHYLYRNLSIIDQYYNHQYIQSFLHLGKEIVLLPLAAGNKHKWMHQKAKIKGYFEGIVQYPTFKRYIDEERKQ